MGIQDDPQTIPDLAIETARAGLQFCRKWDSKKSFRIAHYFLD